MDSEISGIVGAEGERPNEAAGRGALSPQVRWRAALALIVAGIVLALAVVLSNTHADRVADHAASVERSANAVLIDLLNAETGQRGFISTLQPAFLQDYRQGVTALPRDLATLKNASATRPELAAATRTVRALSAAKLAELAQTITLAEQGHRGGAAAIIATGEGKQVMDRVRAQIADIQAQSAAPVALAQHQADLVTDLALGLGVVLLGVALAFSLHSQRAARAARLALAGTEERYRLMVSASSDGWFDVDHHTGRRWRSEHLLSLLGHNEQSLPESIGGAEQMLHPDDGARVHAQLAAGSNRIDDIVRVRHADGHYLTMAMHLIVQRDRNGKPTRTLGTVADLTEQERAEAQRVALARELHDSVVQDLASCKTYAATAQKAAAQRPEVVADVLEVLSEQLASADDNMRLIVRALRTDTTLLEARGSISALTQTLASELRRRDPELTVELSDTLPEELEAGPVASATFGHVLREALLNVLHHSYARHVSIAVSERAGMLCLEVSDDGAGFDPAQAPDGHLGLIGMRERALGAGGDFQLTSSPGQGTQIAMRLPQPFLAPPTGRLKVTA